MVQLSHPYMTTGETIALTRWTFLDKVMCLIFNMLSRLIIAFLPSSKHFFFLISWLAVTVCTWFLEAVTWPKFSSTWGSSLSPDFSELAAALTMDDSAGLMHKILNCGPSLHPRSHFLTCLPFSHASHCVSPSPFTSICWRSLHVLRLLWDIHLQPAGPTHSLSVPQQPVYLPHSTYHSWLIWCSNESGRAHLVTRPTTTLWIWHPAGT